MRGWLIGLCMLVVFAGCAPQQVTVPAPSLGDTPFSSVELGFSIRYPQGWLVEGGELPGVVTFLDNRVKPTIGSLPAFPVSVVVLSATRAELGLPPGALKDQAVLDALYRRLGVGMKIEAKAPVETTLNGWPALRAEVGGTLNMGTELSGRVVALDLGDRVWAAFALSSLKEWPEFEPYFEQMLKSVNLNYPKK